MPDQARTTRSTPAEPSIGQIVFGDLKQADLPRTLRQDFKDLYAFYLSDERREKLAAMGTVKGIFWFWGWLAMGLLTRLTPARRLMLLLSVVLLATGSWEIMLFNVRVVLRTGILGILLVFLVLMLELKDKLLARDEIEVARQVQLALLPRRNPILDGWSIWGRTRPANDIGGDLLDYVPLGNERLGVVLGDVAGKGLGAALLMAKLQATLRAAAPEAEGPGELGARLNEILLRDGLDNRYATLLYFELEPGSGALRYLNAGHPPPCVVRAAGRGAPVEAGSSVSPPLGMLPGARMIEQRLEAADGDLVLLYSDGLTEARNEQDEEFGGERLAALLPALSGMDAAHAGEKILEAVDRFQAGWRLHDDLTLVVLSRARRAV